MISGLDEDDPEMQTSTAEMVTDFFTQTMKVEDPIGVDSATRLGKKRDKPRAVLVKLKNPNDKAKIFKCAKNLKEACNSTDGRYFVNNHLTPQMQERQRWYRHLMHYNTSIAGVGK